MQATKAAYTIPELAQMTGLSRHRIARLLKSNQVRLTRSGRVILVFVSELKKAMPELWDSVHDDQAE